MKQALLFIVIFLVAALVAYPQQRVLISPNDEVIPLKPGESAIEVAKLYSVEIQQTKGCSNSLYDGMQPEKFTSPYSNFGSFHQDVLGQWFIAKMKGTIDSIFWVTLGSTGSFDSTVSIRIFNSNIRPGAGPGYSPYPPPCQPWGYYINTNDSDNHITPFKDEATDTNWVSTISMGANSFDPLGNELWGNGGVTVKNYPDRVNFIALDTLGYKLNINEGDVFFITMRVNGPHVDNSFEARTEWLASSYNSLLPAYQEFYPSRNWKFYEHIGGISNCSGYDIDSLPIGWVARGGFSNDTLYGAAFNWWYSMTVEDDPPQLLLNPGYLEYDTNYTKFCFVWDCPPLQNDTNYFLVITNPVDGGFPDTVRFDDFDSLGCLPLPPLDEYESLCYYYLALDDSGEYVSFPSGCLKNFGGLSQSGYQADINQTYNWWEIGDDSNAVNNWFLNNAFPQYSSPTDDGTSGPFDMGGTFTFFG
ncbi:MAG: hypothetical protein EPO24_03635, partial [Bacteroidetes bacterium]